MSTRNLRAALPALEAARFEIIPTPSVAESVLASLPRNVTLTVTASPTKGLDATIELAERLAAAGYPVVPHVSARLVRDEVHLADVVARIRTAGITDVFVPAGDADPPAGKYHSSLPLLEAIHAMGDPFARVGITGYPQRHPKIEDDVTVQAMWDKRRYATYIVSNLCLDAATLRAWIKRVRSRGVTLPIRIGLAGPVDRTRLVAMASKIGVPDSSRFFRSHAGSALRMAAPGGYNPGRLLARMAPVLADPLSNVEGLHVFTFNQIAEAARWRSNLLDRARMPATS